jgi:hypothetical protein
MSQSLAVTASGLDSAVHAALGSASAGSRVAQDRLPSVAQRRLPPGVMRSLSGSLSVAASNWGQHSRPTSRASSRHSFEGLGQHSVWQPSRGGSPSWERKQVAAFDRSGHGSRSGSNRSMEKLGGKGAHPLGALDNPVPADVQAEVRRLDSLVRAGEQRREQAIVRLAEMQDEMLKMRRDMLAEVEQQEEADVRNVFDGIDLDGNGTLERNELDTLAQRLLHRPLSDKELDQAMRDMDEDGSGEVDFEEFLEWWRSERGNADSPWAGLFADVLDGSDQMVKMKLAVESQRAELEAATRDVRPLVDELQRLLAVAGWHFRVQADGELRGGSPEWRQTYHAGPMDGIQRIESGHETNLAAAAAAHKRDNAEFRRIASTNGMDRSRSRRRKKRAASGGDLKGNLRPVSAASSSSMGPIRLAPNVQDAARIGHRLGMERRPRIIGDSHSISMSSQEAVAWQPGQVKDRVWTVRYPDDKLVREEEPSGRDISNRVWAVRDVWT